MNNHGYITLNNPEEETRAPTRIYIKKKIYNFILLSLPRTMPPSDSSTSANETLEKVKTKEKITISIKTFLASYTAFIIIVAAVIIWYDLSTDCLDSFNSTGLSRTLLV